MPKPSVELAGRVPTPAAALGLIGNTPLVRVRRIDTGPCELYLKLESHNPGGSIKDRTALAMVEAAERAGHIAPGWTLVEATAGNTGLGLALVAAAKGYRLLLVIPDKMSREKIWHLKALGADVVVTRSDVGVGHPDYYQDKARALAASLPHAWYVNQFANPANPFAHETTTAPEIWRQMEGRIDAYVVGVGSGGTLTGLTRYFSCVDPRVGAVLADPEGSILADVVAERTPREPGAWLVEGIGEDFVPPLVDFSAVTHSYSISDAESFAAARELLRAEGILAGSSSGTLLAAALRYCRSRTKPERVVSFVCDSGNKYLSKMFNDGWLEDAGFAPRSRAGDLRDLIGRRADECSVVTVSPQDTLLTAHGRFKLHDVSQLPVLDGEHLVGIIDESDVLLAVLEDGTRFRAPVAEYMSTQLETVAPDAPLSAVLHTLDAGRVPIVCEAGRFLGLVTRMDLLNHLRQRVT